MILSNRVISVQEIFFETSVVNFNLLGFAVKGTGLLEKKKEI